MNAPVEPLSARPYVAGMASAILRLLAVISVLLMPLGMAAAPAAAHGHAAAAMAMQHCPDPSPKSHAANGFGACTMACSAALPAVDLAGEQPPHILCAPLLPASTQLDEGLVPETATPPPKFS